MNYKEWNMNDRHVYFILIDKDVELSDYIYVYNIRDYSFSGSWEEPPYEDIRFDVDVDNEFYKYIHIVDYAYDVRYDEELEEEALDFSIDGNQYFSIPLEDSDNHFDMFVVNSEYAYPIESELDGWWNTEKEAKDAIEAYIERIANEKVEERINE